MAKVNLLTFDLNLLLVLDALLHEGSTVKAGARLGMSQSGVTRKELIAVDQTGQRHRFASQGVNHVAVILRIAGCGT